MGNNLLDHTNVFSLLSCSGVNAYLVMKYLLNKIENFIIFRKRLVKAMISNSYINDNTCGITENNRKIKSCRILETMPTHATDHDKMGLHRKI